MDRVCAASGFSLAAHNSLCRGHFLPLGNEPKKMKPPPRLASGEALGAWGLTEANTGSDAGNMRCTAIKEGGEWVLNGTKNWITHGISGHIAVVVARTGEPRAKNNATAFIVERGTPGFSGGKKENKLGIRANETDEINFDQYHIPATKHLRDDRDVFRQAQALLSS